MKKIFFIVFVILSVISIYVLNFKDKKYIFFLGDYLLTKKSELILKNTEYEYEDNFVFENYHITDLINSIDENIEYNKKVIKHELMKADFIVLSIGMNDYASLEYLNNKNDNILMLQRDYIELFELLRKYTKERIILIGLYDNTSCNFTSPYLFNLNEFLKKETIIYEIDYIDILEEMKNTSNLKCDSVYPTVSGYNVIKNKIIDIIN